MTALADIKTHDIPDLLEMMVARYNLEALEFDRLAEYNDQLESEHAEQAGRIQELLHQLSALQQRSEEQALQLAALTERNTWLEAEHEKSIASLKKAEIIAREAVSQKRQLEAAQAALNGVRQELTQLKGPDNPKKLREQVKRLKDKNTELTAKSERLQREGNQYRAELKTERDMVQHLRKELYTQEVKHANTTFTRLWTEGEHHIMLWPEAITVQDVTTGEASKGRALLYMHNSMRGALLTLDETTGSARMGTSPKGGLKPSKAAKQFADNWLYKVNSLQNGDVKTEDLHLFSE